VTPRRAPITAPSAWEGRRLRQRTDWIEVLAAAELAEIGRAIETSGVREMPCERITKGGFPLPGLADRLGEAAAEVRDGRGFCLLRGFPAAAYTVDDACRIFWALGLHFGTPVSQNSDEVAYVRSWLLAVVSDVTAQRPLRARKPTFRCPL